jgi:hypothetical protein
MLIKNENFIRQKYPELWNELSPNEGKFMDDGLGVEVSQNGFPTLTTVVNDKKVYFHSRYDPFEESKLFLEKFDHIDEYDHILIYGLGLGYHVETIIKKFPNKLISIYEPNPAVFYKFLDSRLFEIFGDSNLRSVAIEWHPSLAAVYLNDFASKMNEKVLLIKHPIYERLYEEKVTHFTETFSNMIKGQINHLNVNNHFEKSWTYNCIKNLPEILKTQNMISEKRKFFEGKPVLLVAAGPSLQDEIENIRKIKEEGTAYIFAVGSANKALIKNGIYPDAVTSYDPWTNLGGRNVFSDVTDAGITTIPLIFGSSVGFNAVKEYTGPLLHMFISQDTISPYYLGSDQITDRNSLISDSPTISIITLQLLEKLNCSLIVLVGQNFGYRDNQYYAQGIHYDIRPTNLSDQEIRDLVEAEDVVGEKVYSNPSFIEAKNYMQSLIAHLNHLEFINTTKGGVKIEGATFQTLEQVMAQRLKKRVVQSNWYNGEKTAYNLNFVKDNVIAMEKEFKKFEQTLDKLIQVIKVLDKHSNSKISIDEKRFVTFDKNFKDLVQNKFYQVYVYPMVRNQHQMLSRSLSTIRQTREARSRAKMVTERFGKYIYECRQIAWQIESDFLELHKELLEICANPQYGQLV